MMKIQRLYVAGWLPRIAPLKKTFLSQSNAPKIARSAFDLDRERSGSAERHYTRSRATGELAQRMCAALKLT
jgi:hypothetical protein